MQSETPTSQQVPLNDRMFTYFSILVIGMLLCIRGIAAIAFYPMGLTNTFSRITGIVLDDEGGILPGYSFYIALLIGFLMNSRPSTIRILTYIMVIATIMNVVGCNHMLKDLSGLGH